MLNLLLVIGGALLGTGALIQSAGVGTGAKGLAIGFASAGGVLLWLLSLIYGTAIVVLVIVAMAQGAVWRGLWLLLGSVISVIMAAALVAAGIIVGPRLVESRRAAATASAQAEARIAESADAAAAAATRDQILAEAARAARHPDIEERRRLRRALLERAWHELPSEVRDETRNRINDTFRANVGPAMPLGFD